MRRLTDPRRLQAFMEGLARAVRRPSRVYFTGGATALLFGWRPSTVDVDIALGEDSDEILRALPALKEALEINIELASPGDFIPELPGWQERSPFISRIGRLDFYHYDLYAQALSKIERGHELDVSDVQEMLSRGLVEPDKLLELFGRIEPELFRFPAIDPGSFRRRVEEVAGPDRS